MTETPEQKLKRLIREQGELLKKLDWFEKQGHTTVGIDFLRRHLGKEAKK